MELNEKIERAGEIGEYIANRAAKIARWKDAERGVAWVAADDVGENAVMVVAERKAGDDIGAFIHALLDIGGDKIGVSAASESRVFISVKTEIADDMDNLIDALNDFRGSVSVDCGGVELCGEFFELSYCEEDNYRGEVGAFARYKGTRYPVEIVVVYPWTDARRDAEERLEKEEFGTAEWHAVVNEIADMHDADNDFDYRAGTLECIEQ